MVCLLDQGTLSALARRLAVEMGGSDIEGHRELQNASPRAGTEAAPRQLAELARQFAILGAGAMQRKRVFIQHAPVYGGNS